jgi:hypothetical protein
MAQTDRYDRMNTAQLEDEATQRGIDLAEFQQLANNSERAQRLRDHDTQTEATNDQAAQNAQDAAARQAETDTQDQQAQDQQAQDQQAQAQQQAEEPARQAQDDRNAQAAARDTQPGGSPAPYSSDEDFQNRVDAASGNLTTTPAIDPDDAAPVGGQTRPTVNGEDQDLKR